MYQYLLVNLILVKELKQHIDNKAKVKLSRDYKKKNGKFSEKLTSHILSYTN